NSAEIYLTHQIAVFRAIEARRTIVRVTNTGLTSVIDFTGKSIYNLDPYKADLLVISIPVRNRDK
ncbi:MAG: apolipoprotein N-acyltransferase, partial [Candidatus Omnitrophica bacterium]|nr:apolipoprotein N-acyltransferase [Candidatus Omnitrophota bacterium]